jgi:hypothetical protein
MDFNTFLQIPERMLLRKKLPKSFFLKNFDLSAPEKKLLSDDVDGMELLANIKSANSNIPTFLDADLIYEEIQVMTCALSQPDLARMAPKVCNLFQKYIPYPILLIIEEESNFVVSTAEKRVNLNDRTKRTIESNFISPVLSKLYRNEKLDAFSTLIKFPSLDSTNLWTLYGSFTNALIKLQSFDLTGKMSGRTGVRNTEELALLREIEALKSDIQRLSNQMKSETQLNKRVALNMEIQTLRSTIETKTKLLAAI